ncbi:MAG: ABC transporter ATP-binding protein [Tepidiformaceae bacterium]
MLELRNVRAAYGPVVALHDISISVPNGAIITLLGANGAGKSTTLRVISGLLKPLGGSVLFEGESIAGHSPDSLVNRGISHVPEGRQIFTTLTVDANLQLGAYTRKDKRNIAADMTKVYEYFPQLAQRKKQVAGTLSGGEQQMLAIGRSLMARPRLLLLDEPSLGLAPLLVRDIFKIIQAINEEQKMTILLVEQDARIALSVASYGYVLETGNVAVHERASVLQSNEAIRKSYLGY